MAEQLNSPSSPTPQPAPAPRQPFVAPRVENAGRLTEITLQLSGGGGL
ncbi:MAG TPA: hypothetical protein VF584_07425 [Longimicrobium sp.]